jgi:hypothetical protein
MTYEQFVEKYKPVKNHLETNAAFDGFMFETFGFEVEHVKATPAKHIWTLVDAEGQDVICAGWHLVNRIGYFCTDVPWEDEGLTVELEMVDPDETGNPDLMPFRVQLKENKEDKHSIFFDCQAQNEEHAEEQALNAYPNGETIRIVNRQNREETAHA